MNSAYTEKFPIDQLKVYERNPRKISDRAIDATMKSIRMNSSLDPIEVDEDGVILAGHTRRLAYLKLGYTEVPVVQHIGLTATQKRTYRIASNKIAEYSEWDDELLAAELKDIDLQIEQLQESTGIDTIFPEQFEAGTIDEQWQLDKKEPIVCPKCEHEWTK